MPKVTVIVWSKICVFAVASCYVLHVKKYGAIMFPLVSYTNEMCRLVLHHCIQNLWQFLAIFAVQPMHFVWEGFVFTPTAPYIVNL